MLGAVFYSIAVLLATLYGVDLVEPASHFLEAARETLASGKLMFSDMHKAANFYCVPLQITVSINLQI
ncbi:Alpha N-terminal protein methyltransferase 1 [Vitis vinifera]|uniref:Alpha N-terminal protein methyltransferase 1 n=1 Tax=Vitis vinifera TaxID=29760 RepID=A0A438DZN4_VITVI|nr:Alpha N-terminal protein methyltransferase 1 [Vitis vinifera]